MKSGVVGDVQISTDPPSEAIALSRVHQRHPSQTTESNGDIQIFPNHQKF